MNAVRVVFMLTLFFPMAFAHAGSGREAGLFAGVGLDNGRATLKTTSSAPSRFSSQGYVLESGFTFGSQNGVQLSAEAGAQAFTNTSESQSYLEVGNLNHYGAKASAYFGMFGIGAGYRHNELKVKSVSLSPAGYLENKLEGWTPMGFANMTASFNKRYRGVIEVQYIDGMLKSATTESLKFNEINIGLSLQILFN